MRIFEVTKKRNKWVLVFGGAISAVGMIMGAMDIIAGNPKGGLTGLVGFFIMIVVFYFTVREINEQGVDEMATIFGLKKHSVWNWEDVSFLFADFRKQAPYVILSIRKGNNRRTVRVEKKDVQKVFDWAATANPDITMVHNSGYEFITGDRRIMTAAEYRESEHYEHRPATFHELANEIRRMRREEKLQIPELTSVKIKRAKKHLKSWR